jgi:hypothetical protein
MSDPSAPKISPSFRNFKITDFLCQIFTWRNDLNRFFKDITGLEPRVFQKEFFDEVQRLKSKNLVIVAGRGIGKTLALAVVALWYILVLSVSEGRSMKVTILAGSLDQAKICFGYIMAFVNSSTFLQKQLDKEPTQKEILFKDGSWIRPLPASEKTVRGHHPDLLIIDEAAQVESDLIYAALPMTAPSPYARQIFSTTPSTGFSWVEEKWEHQAEFKYPDWKFFNWNAESFLPEDQLAMLKRSMPEDKYRSEMQGLPYKREGKVFNLEDLKLCSDNLLREEPDGIKYGGVDWGYYPAPTVIVVVQKSKDKDQKDIWKVLYSQPYLHENSEQVLDKIQQQAEVFKVATVYTDSTDKGENLRLSARGLPVQPISFKGEKSIMLSNLKMLIEQHRLKWDPVTQQPLIGEMIDYVYGSKRNDDFVDALMLAVRANPISHPTRDLEAILRESFGKETISLPEDVERKKEIGRKLKEIGRN